MPNGSSAVEDSQRWRHRRRVMARVLLPTGRLLVLALVIEYLVLPQLAGVRKTLHLLSAMDNFWLPFGLAAEVLSLLAYARLSQVTVGGPAGIGFGRMLRIDLSTFAASHVLPAGSAVGMGLGYRLLTRSGVQPAHAVVAKTLQAVGSAVVLNAILMITLICALIGHGNDPIYGPIAGAGVLLMIAVTILITLVIKRQERAERFVGAALGWIPRMSRDTGRRLVRELAHILRQLGEDRRLLAQILGWAAANWLLDAVSLWCFVRAFGHALGPVGLLVGYGLANVAAVLPITPGGLGIVEGILVPTFVAFSTPRGVAILGVIAWRLVQFWLPIPVGFAAYLSLTGLSGLRHQEDGPPATAADEVPPQAGAEAAREESTPG